MESLRILRDTQVRSSVRPSVDIEALSGAGGFDETLDKEGGEVSSFLSHLFFLHCNRATFGQVLIMLFLK